MPGVLLVLTGEDCQGRCAEAYSAFAGAVDPFRHEAHRARRQAGVSRPAHAAAGRQGALCRRAGRHGGRRDAAQAMDAAEAVEVEYEELPYIGPHRGRAGAQPRAAVGRDARQRAGRRTVRRQGRDRRAPSPRPRTSSSPSSTSAASPRVTMELRSARRRLRRRAPAATRSIAAAAARCGRRAEIARHPRPVARQGARALSWRHRRQLRHAQPALSSSSAWWSWASRQDQAAGEVHRDALGGVPHRLPGPRSASPRSRWRFDEGGKILAMRADNVSNVGSRCVSLSPLSKGSGLITGSYDIPAATLRSRAVFTNTMPTRRLSVARAALEVTFAIERLMRQGGRRARHRPHRAPPQEPREAEEDAAIAMRSACSTTAAPTRRTWTRCDEARRRGGLQAAQARGEEAQASCSASAWRTTSSPRSARRRSATQITVKPNGVVDVVIGTQPSGQGHETSFAQVVADLIAVPVEGHQHHHRRHRHRQRRRRLAFRPLDAPRRHRDRQGRARADREGPQDRGARARTRQPDKVEFKDGRFSSRSSNRSFDFLELAEGGRAAHACRPS